MNRRDSDFARVYDEHLGRVYGFLAYRVEDRYTAELLPKKLSLSIEYQARRDCFSDIRILLQTARAVFS